MNVLSFLIVKYVIYNEIFSWCELSGIENKLNFEDTVEYIQGIIIIEKKNVYIYEIVYNHNAFLCRKCFYFNIYTYLIKKKTLLSKYSYTSTARWKLRRWWWF